jgi:hypothetical protein
MRVALCIFLFSASAAAYDFDIDASTTAQGYQLRWTRFSEQNRFLNRRRLTQSLGLDVWNILEPEPDANVTRLHPPPLAPFDLYVAVALRLDHDFSEYTQGTVRYMQGSAPIIESATSTVPELAGQSFALDALYAVVGARRILGFLDAALGRQIVVDSLDWISFDGLSLRARTPWHVALSAFGGWMVRDSSPAATGAREPDGTSASQCTAFSADTGVYEAAPECRQRDEPMPVVGLAAETTGLRAISARIAYRRAFSRTADIYADTRGEAPAWGVNEEVLSASARAVLVDGAVVPWAAARWSFLLHAVDQANAGVRLGAPEWSVTPELSYSLPTFDGDSIFNVFTIDPYWEARVTGDVWPGQGKLRGYVRAFWRRFLSDETGTLLPGESVPGPDAFGVDVGGRWRERQVTARLDLFYEDGYGGRRAGGDASGRWQALRDVEIEGRLSLIGFRDDLLADGEGVSFGAQAGARWVLGQGVALHVLAEENFNRQDASQFRLVAVLDLAFAPEH